jgi:hypothetical protein
MKDVDLDAVREAINSNDLKLARRNWKVVRKFTEEHVSDQINGYYELPLGPITLDYFEFFCKRTQRKGIEYWFPQDPLEHWSSLQEGHGRGWEQFLKTTVADKYQEALRKTVARKQRLAAKKLTAVETTVKA